MSEVAPLSLASSRRPLLVPTAWLGLVLAVLTVACDSNPTPHPIDPDAYPDTFPPDNDRDPESPNGADALEVHTPDPDTTDPTQGFEDNLCDTHGPPDADTDTTDATDRADTTHTPDSGPTDTTDTSDPCDPTSRGPAAGESDSEFSNTNPPPTGPR